MKIDILDAMSIARSTLETLSSTKEMSIPAFPNVDRHAAPLRSKLVAVNSFLIEVAGLPYSFEWQSERQFRPSISVMFKSGEKKFVLLMNGIEEIPGLAVDLLIGLPAAIRLVVVQEAMQSVLATIEKLTNEPCTVLRVSTRSAAAYAKIEGLDFDLKRRDSRPLNCRLVPVDSDAWQAVDKAAQKFFSRTTPSKSETSWHMLRAVLGTSVLSQTLLRESEPGDVLLIESQVVLPLGFALVDSQGKSVARVKCEFGGTTAHITSNQSAMTTLVFDMSDQEPPIRSLNELDVKLTFELGSVVMNAREIEGLKDGTAVELGVAVDNAVVTIRANGRSIGTGKLVTIEDRLAVLLKTLNIDGR